MPRVRVANIGMREAVQLMELNIGNRSISMTSAQRLKGAMLRGEWRLSPDAIAVEGKRDQPGARLRNGQTRLTALIFAAEQQPDLRLPFIVMDDMDPSAAEVTDLGRVRTLEDVLIFHGESEVPPRYLAPTIGLAWHVANDTYHHRIPTPTRPQQLEFLKDNPDLREAVRLGVPMARATKVSAAGTCVAAWLIGQGNHADQLPAFAAQVATGEHIDANMMSYRLRERFMRSEPGGPERRAWNVCALVVTAWNAHVSGRTIAMNASHPQRIPDVL